MNNHKCNICSHGTSVAFRATVLGKYEGTFRKCNNCGFLFADNPHWLDEAYSQPITQQDTGMLNRNYLLQRQIFVLLHDFFDLDSNYLDYAGGKGILVRLMRDAGLNFFHYDKYTINEFAADFSWHGEPSRFRAITCIECFEHFSNPIMDIENMLKLSQTIIFTTSLLKTPIPDREWYYYGFEHGQHISFFTPDTLSYIAHKYGINKYSCGNLHILTESKLSRRSFCNSVKSATRSTPLMLRTRYDRLLRKLIKYKKQSGN